MVGRKVARRRRQADNQGTLAWWVPGLLFVVATLILFGGFIFSDQMLFGEDTLSAGYMARADFAERLGRGDFPVWAPRLLGGIPFIEAIAAGDSIYPTSLLYFVMEPYRVLGWKLVLHVLAGGFFMYGWARHLGLSRAAAAVGGLAWLMAPVMVTLTLAGNDGKLMVAALAPLVFWATGAVVRSPDGRSAAALAGAVALTSLTTQFQTAYFLFCTAGAYALFRAIGIWRGGANAHSNHAAPRKVIPGTATGIWRGGRDAHSTAGGARRAGFGLGLFALGALLGGGIAAVQLVPAAQYVTESSRRVATTVSATPEEAIRYSSSWSWHPEEIVSLVVPEFVGNTTTEAAWGRQTYWGRNALKLNHEYLGVTVVAFALFALVGSGRRALKWFMAAMSLIWLLFALGVHTPLWRIFYEVVPGISLFRAPSLSAFLVSFGVTTMFALGVEELMATDRRRPEFWKTRRARALLAFSGLLLIALVMQATGLLTSLWTAILYSDIGPRGMAALETATPHITRGFGVALLFSALVSVAAWAAWQRVLPRPAILAILAVLVALDLVRIDRAFIRNWDYHAWTAPNDNTRFLQQQRAAGAPFRVADMRGSVQNVDLAMFGVDLVGGHHPNDLARYRKLLGLEGSALDAENLRNPNVLRITNVRYLLWPEEAAGGPPYAGAEAISSAEGPRGREAVYPFPGLDRAWVVGRFSVMSDDDEAVATITGADFNPAREAILAEPLDLAVSLGAQSPVVWELDEPDERRLRIQVDGPALLVISENWFPGWVATVNGEEAPVLRANVTLQAVPILEAGEHVIDLRFTAPTVARALWISVAAAAGTVVIWGTSLRSIRLGRRRKLGD